jgi:DNA modification methylase
MFQMELFDPIYADQYIEEGFTFIVPKVGDVTFLNGLSEPVHRWFRLTPSYSPELVRFLTEHLDCNSKTLLLDPFLGKGTTLIEAKRLGLYGFGIELNPLLKLASEYALTWDIDHSKYSKHFADFEERILKTLHEAKRLSIEKAVEQFQLTIPPIHNVFRWWKRDVLKELLLIRSVVWNVRDERYRRLYWLALCSSALDCANIHRNHPTISFADDHDREINVWGDFRENVEAVIADLRRLPPQEAWGNTSVILGDSTQLSTVLDKSVDRVITSPPYPNRFSYIHTTRPQLFFMEVFSKASESAEVDCAAIGGTWGKATSMLYEGEVFPNKHIADVLSPLIKELRPRSNLMCNYAVKYFNMMDNHIGELRKLATKKFKGAYVVGNSRLSDTEIFTDILLARIFERNGFKVNRILVLRKRGGRKKLYETAVCVTKS